MAVVKITHLDISDFTNNEAVDFPFAVDNVKTAQALRRLADQVEAGEIALQSIEMNHEAKLNDFQLTQLLLSYARRHHKETP